MVTTNKVALSGNLGGESMVMVMEIELDIIFMTYLTINYTVFTH